MKKQYLECGKIINTHGVAGAVKIEPWCDDPYVLARKKHIFFLKDGQYEKVKVIYASVFKRFVLATLEGVSDVDSAALLKETVIYASRDDFKLEEGDYFISDLIGLNVVDNDDNSIIYGTLSDVINYGASDIYEIDTPNGKRLMPAVPEFVKSIDTEKGIYISPIEGMFDLS